jgi:plasmid stabilization system protein ParE
VKLRYTPRALIELDEVLAYIAEHSPQAAWRVQTRIQAITALLLLHPFSGRRTSNPRLRRIAVTPYPYLVFYEARDDEIIIHAVRHGARDPASMPGEGSSRSEP